MRTAAAALALILAAALGPAARAAELSFAVVGHVRGPNAAEPSYLLDELVREIAALRPDHVFLTGDCIWGDYHETEVSRERVVAEWERLDRAFAAVGAPVHRVPGNHDVSDPVTRDVFRERYGELPRALDAGGVRFLLLRSAWQPEGDAPPRPGQRPHVRGVDLDPAQLAFLRGALADAEGVEHAFVFVHHVLWWERDAAWWREVHPLLAGSSVRAVFAGDYGPLKFSHERRDGIDYYQSSIETQVPVRLLRNLEPSRLLYFQFDHFLHVTVSGPDVRVEVRVVDPRATAKLTPERWREVFRPEAGAAAPASGSLLDDVRGALGGPLRQAALAALLAAAFAGGLALGRTRRRR